MRRDDDPSTVGAEPLRRFWRTASGFWTGSGAWIPWTLIALLVVCVVTQLLVQYRLNLWNRDFFNALERREGREILQQTYLLPILAGCSVGLAVCVGLKMAYVIERKNQAESELKFAVAHLRSLPRPTAGHSGEQSASVSFALGEVIRQWRRLCGQHMRTTLVSHGNTLLAPLVGLLLCVSQYIHQTMSLGEVTQAAAAFAAVQGAFNWLVDNYPRLAEWASSASRVGVLLVGLDMLRAGQGPRRSVVTDTATFQVV